MQKRQHRPSPQADLFERAANPEITPRGDKTFLERFNRFRCSACLVIYLREIQVKLRVIASHADGLAAE